MKDQSIKALAAFLLRNKGDLASLLEYFDPNDIERGVLNVPEEFFNGPLKRLLFSRPKFPLKDYRVTFSRNLIFLDAAFSIKQLGPISAKYMISLQNFEFSPQGRYVGFAYQEDVRSLGTPLQAMMLKTAMGQSTLLERACQLWRQPGVQADRDRCVMDLSAFEVVRNGALADLTLHLKHIEDGQICCSFTYGH